MFVNTSSKVIWKNGTYEKWEDSSIHILSHTVHYGTGVFEGVRAYNTANGPAIFRLEDHTNRLFDAASKIGVVIPYSKEELNQAQKEIFEQYCCWIFPLMFRFDELDNQKSRTGYQQRVNAFMAERMMNIFVLHNKLRVKELPYVLVGNKRVAPETALL